MCLAKLALNILWLLSGKDFYKDSDKSTDINEYKFIRLSVLFS